MHQPPFTIGAAIGDTLRVWLKKLPGFTLLAILCCIPLLVFAVATAESMVVDQPGLWAGIFVVIWLPAYMLLAGMITYGTVQEMRGLRAPIGRCLAIGLQRLAPLIGASFLAMLAIFAGSLLLVVPGVIVALMLFVIAPAVVAERVGVVEAFKRSRELTDGYKWTLLGLYLVAIVVYLGLGFAGGIAVALFSAIAAPLGMIFQGLLQAALMSFFAVMSAVTYSQLRQVKEGSTVDDLAAIFD